LIGDVLLVRPGDVIKTALLYLSIGLVHFVFRRQFLALSFDPREAERMRLNIKWWDFWFYALFGFVVTSFVQIGGVLLVFSYLIIPAACASYLASSLGGRLLAAWLVATLGSIGGLFCSYQFDLPTGAAIVCALGACLVLSAIALHRRRRPPPPDQVQSCRSSERNCTASDT
jgi:zinc/manganese transport system permease protein